MREHNEIERIIAKALREAGYDAETEVKRTYYVDLVVKAKEGTFCHTSRANSSPREFRIEIMGKLSKG